MAGDVRRLYPRFPADASARKEVHGLTRLVRFIFGDTQILVLDPVLLRVSSTRNLIGPDLSPNPICFDASNGQNRSPFHRMEA
jgi:hypothetical protein